MKGGIDFVEQFPGRVSVVSEVSDFYILPITATSPVLIPLLRVTPVLGLGRFFSEHDKIFTDFTDYTDRHLLLPPPAVTTSRAHQLIRKAILITFRTFSGRVSAAANMRFIWCPLATLIGRVFGSNGSKSGSNSRTDYNQRLEFAPDLRCSGTVCLTVARDG